MNRYEEPPPARSPLSPRSYLAPSVLSAYEQEKAAAHQQALETAKVGNIATLERTRVTYPATYRALFLRLANWPGPAPSLAFLPPNVVSALAQAQFYQNTGFAVGVASAKAAAAAGGGIGARLSALLSSPGEFDLAAAKLIREPSFPVHLHVLELIGGVVPLIALMSDITRRHHCSQGVTPGGTVLKAAQEARFLNSKGALDITAGCARFMAAYSDAASQGHRFAPGPVYRALISGLSLTVGVTTRIAGLSWDDDCAEILARFRVRHTQCTSAELADLVE